jgi:RNA polymerase sigma-70 factor (ECF subfamily)
VRDHGLVAWDWAELRQSAVRETRSLLSDPQDAEDAAQEAMVRAWRQRAACRSPEAPEGWLRRIARNEAFRRHGRRPEPPAEPKAAEVAETLDEMVIDRLFLRETLSELRLEERHLLLLRYQLDLPDVAIARRLGIAESTVRVRLHRLRLQLRVLMADRL